MMPKSVRQNPARNNRVKNNRVKNSFVKNKRNRLVKSWRPKERNLPRGFLTSAIAATAREAVPAAVCAKPVHLTNRVAQLLTAFH